jgi:ATP-dependent Lon protease
MRYLMPKQIKANGLKPEELKVARVRLRDIVRYYTRESGVRSSSAKLPRSAARWSRNRARRTKAKKAKTTAVTVTSKNLDKYLGVRRYDFGRAESRTRLAW